MRAAQGADVTSGPLPSSHRYTVDVCEPEASELGASDVVAVDLASWGKAYSLEDRTCTRALVDHAGARGLLALSERSIARQRLINPNTRLFAASHGCVCRVRAIPDERSSRAQAERAVGRGGSSERAVRSQPERRRQLRTQPDWKVPQRRQHGRRGCLAWRRAVTGRAGHACVSRIARPLLSARGGACVL